ncbi:glycosyltransferase [Variovorax sp. LT1R16]
MSSLGDEFEFLVLTGDRDLGEKSPYSSVSIGKWTAVGKAKVFYANSGKGYFIDVIRQIRTNKIDILYLNSFFSFRSSIFPILVAKIFRRNLPIVLAPRGEFSEGALAIRSSKKNIFLGVVKCLRIYRGVVWQASTDHELKDVSRVIGVDANCRVAINISLPKDEVLLPACREGGVFKIIFLSRISRKKNLLGAINMLYGMRGRVCLDVYGPKEDIGYWDECFDAASKLPVNVDFKYCGEAVPEDVSGILARYDLFFFPTYGENFGHVIAEAVSVGLPVLISDLTPWRNLEEIGLGWDVSLAEPEVFLKHIEDCCEMPMEAYLQWRRSIRQWARDNLGNEEVMEANRNLFLQLGVSHA